MFHYIQIRSGFFICFTWFLLFALFADTVNLDDYLPNSFSIHLDDIDMINQSIVDSILPNSLANSMFDYQSALKYNTYPEKPSKAIVVLYDLDSLSLAASSSFEKEIIAKSINNVLQNTLEITSFKSGTTKNIYLQNQSFII